MYIKNYFPPFRKRIIISGLLFTFLTNAISFPTRIALQIGDSMGEIFISQLLLFIMSLLIWEVVYRFIMYGFKNHILNAILVCVCSIALSFIFYYFNPFKDIPKYVYSVTKNEDILILQLIFRGAILSLIYYPFIFYTYKQYLESVEYFNDEKVKRYEIAHQFQALQDQLNPHFLFNALNILKSGTKDEWVKEYASEIAKVYRYHLNNHSDKHLIPVEEEICQINSLYKINKVRYGDGLELEINVSDYILKQSIPIFAIQLCFENAIKHNSISEKSPLYIEIYNDNENLYIKNNIQLRQNAKLESNGVGIKNIQKRYKIISNKNIKAEVSNNNFIVTIPVL